MTLFEIPPKEYLPYWLLLWVITISLALWIIGVLIQTVRKGSLGTQPKEQRIRNNRILVFILFGYTVGIGIILYKMGAPLKDIIVVPVLMAVFGGLRILRNWNLFR